MSEEVLVRGRIVEEEAAFSSEEQRLQYEADFAARLASSPEGMYPFAHLGRGWKVQSVMGKEVLPELLYYRLARLLGFGKAIALGVECALPDRSAILHRTSVSKWEVEVTRFAEEGGVQDVFVIPLRASGDWYSYSRGEHSNTDLDAHASAVASEAGPLLRYLGFGPV